MSSISKFILVLCITLACTTLASASTYDITATGVNDQDKINNVINAASPGDIIALHGTFLISSPINMKSNIILKGDGSNITIIKAASRTAFSSANMIILSNVKNAELYGFTIHGGATSVEDQHSYGGTDDYHAGMKVDSGSSDCKIHDIDFTMLYGDGIRAGTSSTTNINVYNCRFLTSGHDGLDLWNAENWKISNCLIDVFVNCGVRFAGCTNCVIDHCTIYGDLNSGWTEIELEGNVNGIVIDHNILRDMYGSTGHYAIAPVGASGTITLSNNVIYGCSGGVNTAGITVENTNNQYTNANIPADVGYNTTSISTEIVNNPTNNYESSNITEITLSSTESSKVEVGTGRYQSILNLSISGYSNKLIANDMTKVLYWSYPDTISYPYESVVIGYQPTVTTT